MDTAIMPTVLSINRVDSRRFSSRGCAFRRKHTSTDPIRLLCIQLALPLTLSLPSIFAPSAKLLDGVLPRALWLAGAFSCESIFWDYRGGGHTRQPSSPPVTQQPAQQQRALITWTRGVLAQDIVCSGVQTRAQTLFCYLVSD